MLSLEGESVQSLVRELRSHKLHGAPHSKTLSVCRDPVSHLHQDWATSTALPLGTHCFHKFLRITVAKLIFVLIPANIILNFGSANFGLVVSAFCASWAYSIGKWCIKARNDISGEEVISACLTQGNYDIPHPHVKPSSHLGSGNLDLNVTPLPKQWQEHRITTPCHWDQLLSRVIHLQCRLLIQSRHVISG